MLIRVVDFESTGLPEAEGGAAICEVGWCDVEVNIGETISAVVGTSRSVLCDPGRPIPPEIRAVHHIGDADVAGAMNQETALAMINDGMADYFVAHHCTFEQALFPQAGKPWLCTYRAAVRLWPDAPGHSNQVLRYWLGLELANEFAMPPHRAAPDAYVTAHILARIIEDGRASIEDLARWSSGPPLLPRINFGKHRGAKWEDVPTNYLDWIVNKSDLDGDTKANARHHLKARATRA